MVFKAMTDSKAAVKEADSTEILYTSLDQLDCADYGDFPLKSPQGDLVRFQGQPGPWTFRIQRGQVPQARAQIKKLGLLLEKGQLTNNDYENAMISAVLIGWQNCPTPFSLQAAQTLLADGKKSWIKNFIIEKAVEDSNFFTGV